MNFYLCAAAFMADMLALSMCKGLDFALTQGRHLSEEIYKYFVNHVDTTCIILARNLLLYLYQNGQQDTGESHEAGHSNH